MRAASKGPFTIPKKRGQKNTKRYGVGKPAKPNYQYKARPKVLNTRNRSDNPNAGRFPIEVRVNGKDDLEIRTKDGRLIDARLRIVKAAKAILHDFVADLGGPTTLTQKQKYELEVVLRRTLVGRELFERFVKGDDTISQKIGATNDLVMLKGLSQLYK